MNEFLHTKFKDRFNFIEKNASGQEYHELYGELLVLAKFMNSLGVNSEKDYKDIFYITNHTKSAAEDILKRRVNSSELAEISSNVYTNRQEFPINTIVNLYKSVKNAIDNSNITIKKKAYPQGFETNYIQPPHNIKKWIESMRKIYAIMHKGFEFNDAFAQATKDWGTMEKSDFKNWMNFYQGNQHEVYKTANEHKPNTFVGGEQGAQFPLGMRARIPNVPDLFNRQEAEEVKSEQAREKAIRQEESQLTKAKLIGRLNSAEKLFTSVNFMEGAEFEEWLKELHNLKRKIFSLKTADADMIEDLIIRSGNQLEDKGLYKSATVMHRIAQPAPPPTVEDPMPVMSDGDEELGGSFPDDLEGIPDLDGSLTGDVAGGSAGAAPGDAEEGVKDLSDPDGAMLEFLKNLGGTKVEAASDNFDGAYIVVGEDDGLRVNAQVLPEETVKPMETAKPVETADLTPKSNVNTDAATDAAINAALANVKYSDIIYKLEDVASILKVRQLTRELSIVDLMMQSMGISSFFPNMAEATKSALDSNQYVLTRVEDILAKLRGASSATDGSIDTIRQKFEASDDNDSAKKQQKEEAKMVPGAGLEPEAGVPAQAPAPAPELQRPTQIQQPLEEGVRI
jgi:hypothetical protein